MSKNILPEPPAVLRYDLVGGEKATVYGLTYPDQVGLEHGFRALQTLSNAYETQFVDRADMSVQIPAGTFENKFKPTDAKTAENFAKYMSKQIKGGAQYLYIEQQDGELGSWDGLIKTTPSYPREAGRFARLRGAEPNMYIAELVVPHNTGRGYGSALIYAATTLSRLGLEKAVVLDNYEDNVRANKWYQRLGALPVAGADITPFSVVVDGDEHVIPQSRFSTEGNVTAGRFIDGLRVAHGGKIVRQNSRNTLSID